MLILADENCDAMVVARLRESGHDVVNILEQKPGMPDDEVFEAAAAQGRILLTNDLGFGISAERLDIYPPAVILMRLYPLTADVRADIVTKFFESLRERTWRRRLFVIEAGLVRERSMGRPAR